MVKGGGGTLCWSGATCPRIVVLGSLAKALGAPAAFLAASDRMVRWFEALDGTRVHASPCSAASLAALEAALDHCEQQGARLRAGLLARVREFRRAAGAPASGLRGGA